MEKAKIFLGLLMIILLINNINSLTIESVRVNPESISPGDTAIIRIEMENTEDSDIEDINIYLDLQQVPFAPFQSSSEVSIDEIKENRVKFIEFKLIALGDSESGIYKIPIKSSYLHEDNNERINKESLISLNINSLPEIKLTLEENLAIKNMESEITIKVVNKGLSDVKFLEVEIKPSISYEILSPREVYVGDLDSDDFDSVDYKLFFKENSLSTTNIPITIKYKDALNKEYEEETILIQRVYSKEKAVELGLIKESRIQQYVIIVIILIIVYLIYKRFRKNKKKTPKS